VFDFSLPTHATGWSAAGFTWDGTECRTTCSWFGFLIRVKPTAPFTRAEFARYLDREKIGSRMLFGGNLLKQPVFVGIRQETPEAIRVIGEMTGADQLMNEAIFLGTYPGLTPAQINQEVALIRSFVKAHE
jgi:CDP-6-deoxy-D-xylo-4-hexulose-3-dehydrase